MSKDTEIVVGLAQIAPVWLNRAATIDKIISAISEAADGKCDLVVFGEGILPGYPFWPALTNGAEWNTKIQKELHAHYIRNAVQPEAGDLDSICSLAKQKGIAVYLGTIERAANRGGHSLYASLVYIDKSGQIKSVHRKLQPTYDERLTWSPGDGNGLQVHSLEGFTVGGLNCWENWMPLARTSLYTQGENLHVAVWPGSARNTIDITRFIALEARSYVISVSGLMRKEDFPEDTPHLDKILENCPQILADGGSCIAGPDGKWIVEPFTGNEGVYSKVLKLDRVLEERQNFDPSGHYSRPDVTRLIVNRERQSLIQFD
ncbi:carbon-nitrogen hydrolase family protein [Bacteroidota bacterium]